MYSVVATAVAATLNFAAPATAFSVFMLIGSSGRRR